MKNNEQIGLEKSFTIEINSNLSINNLVELQKSGLPIVRSAHVGNTSNANLALAEAGLRFILLDHNIGNKDHTYFPHTLMLNNNREIISNPNTLVTHAIVEREPIHFARLFPKGAKLALCHLAGLQELFPNTEITNLSNFIISHRPIVEKILHIIINNNPNIFERYVDNSGNISELDIENKINLTSTDIYNQGIFNIDNKNSGLLLPVSVLTLINSIIDAIEHNSTTVYHLSGPDMVNYIGKYENEIDSMYKLLKQDPELKLLLPEQLKFILIPTASAKLVTVIERKKQLDELISSLIQKYEIDKQREDFLNEKEIDSESEEGKNAFRKSKIKNIERLKKAIVSCIEANPNLSKGRFITQYDVLNSSSQLYVPEYTYKTSFAQLARDYALIKENMPK